MFKGATPPTEVIEKFGADYGGYVCLHPVGSDLDPKGSKYPPFVRVAIRAEIYQRKSILISLMHIHLVCRTLSVKVSHGGQR